MNENTESQVAPETTEAEASTNSADASLDYEALYHQEIKNSKKHRRIVIESREHSGSFR